MKKLLTMAPRILMRCAAIGRPGGWDPVWDDVANAKVVRPFKLHKRERDREDRYATCPLNYCAVEGHGQMLSL